MFHATDLYYLFIKILKRRKNTLKKKNSKLYNYIPCQLNKLIL